MHDWKPDDEMLLSLLRRKRTLLALRTSFTELCRLAGFEPAQHHLLIIDAVTELVNETAPRRKLMIFMPPGSAKSTYASVLFPPWFMSRFPQKSILAASHSEELSERFGRRVRNIIEEHHAALGINTSPGNRSIGRWQLAPRSKQDDPLHMGEYLAAGAGSAIAGFRADLGLIDDPIKSREASLSETQRTKLWDWYRFDFRPRLKPNALQVLIMTRWHEEDLAAQILAEEGDSWIVIRLPMEAEELNDPLGRAIGERLWKEWFTEEMVATAKREAALWLSLYQQRPTAETGTYWKKHWLHPVPHDQVPKASELKVYGASDYAVTESGGDYTVHMVIGLDPNDRPWLLDIWREQTNSEIWVNAWCDMVRQHRPMSWAEEQGQIISGVGPWIMRASHERKAYTERLQFASRFDKAIRAQSMRAMISTKGLWYSESLANRAAFESELLAFPAGKNDDMHDALGLIGQMLDLAVHGQYPKEPEPKVVSGYKPMGGAATASSRWRTM